MLYLQRLFDSVKGRQPQGGELNLLPDESSGFANTVHCFPARRGKWEITGIIAYVMAAQESAYACMMVSRSLAVGLRFCPQINCRIPQIMQECPEANKLF